MSGSTFCHRKPLVVHSSGGDLTTAAQQTQTQPWSSNQATCVHVQKWVAVTHTLGPALDADPSLIRGGQSDVCNSAGVRGEAGPPEWGRVGTLNSLCTRCSQGAVGGGSESGFAGSGCLSVTTAIDADETVRSYQLINRVLARVSYLDSCARPSPISDLKVCLLRCCVCTSPFSSWPPHSLPRSALPDVVQQWRRCARSASTCTALTGRPAYLCCRSSGCCPWRADWESQRLVSALFVPAAPLP